VWPWYNLTIESTSWSIACNEVRGPDMAESSSRRGLLTALGVLMIVAGLVVAVVMWTLGGNRRTDAVEGFARAPVGCDTTLDFVETGEYFVFIESAGQLDEIRGDCDIEGPYDVGSSTPDVEITIVDPDGAPVDLDRAVTMLDYDAGGFVGSAAFTIDIAQTDDHVVRVESPDDEVFVVAIGRDPDDGVAALRLGAIALGLVGLLVGAGLIVLGARSARAKVQAPQWAPGPGAPPAPFAPGQVPQGPPVYGQQAGPPQYAPSPGQYGQPPQPGQYGQAPPFGAPQYGQAPQPSPPQYGQPSPPASPPQAAAPQFGQPAAPSDQGGAPQYVQPAPPPPPPSPAPQAPAGQPSIPGQPGWGSEAPTPAAPMVPPHPADSAQPIDWAPQRPAEDARQRPEPDPDPARTEERPPPPPPS
jgi:hypothetical protein